MKSALLSIITTFATFLCCYFLMYISWLVLKHFNTRYLMEALIPLFVLVGASVSNFLIQNRLLSPRLSLSIGSSLFSSLIVLILAPAWYPTLHWSTIIGGIMAVTYVNFRPYVVNKIKAYNQALKAQPPAAGDAASGAP